MSKLTLKTEGDRQAVLKRHLAAQPEVVYRAHTDGELLARPIEVQLVFQKKTAEDFAHWERISARGQAFAKEAQ